MVWARTAFTCGAESKVVTIGYVSWSSMTFGGRPGQGVCTMTCTSEMSGNASSGIRCSDQIPASNRNRTPANTRNRFRAHHSMRREIIALHPSRCSDVHTLGQQELAALLRADCDLPCTARAEIQLSRVGSISLIVQLGRSIHLCHAHFRHSR